ncbi:hypothetical protein AB4427_19975 [Vibrio artabrorum]|uniref:hypothetical protein n=1 Tax=Vibrio artabrorum TaxID=446374 RepID=UPI003552A5DA
MSSDFSVWLSAWGAILSTVLAFLKIKETYNNRFQIGVSHVFRSEPREGNDISIQNLSGTPVLLTYMEVYYRPKGFFSFIRSKKYIWSPEDRMLNQKIEPHSEETYYFYDGDYFTWNNKKIYVKLHFAGKDVIEKRVGK